MLRYKRVMHIANSLRKFGSNNRLRRRRRRRRKKRSGRYSGHCRWLRGSAAFVPVDVSRHIDLMKVHCKI